MKNNQIFTVSLLTIFLNLWSKLKHVYHIFETQTFTLKQYYVEGKLYRKDTWTTIVWK